MQDWMVAIAAGCVRMAAGFGCAAADGRQSGGMAGKVAEYPFDTVKVRLQTGAFSGPFDCVGKTLRNEGPMAFYKGLSTPLVGSAFEISTLFFFYDVAEKFLKKEGEAEMGMARVCAAGGFSGLGSTVVLTPVELIKCRLQVQQGSTGHKGPIAVIRHVIQTDGVAGLYRGFNSTCLREVVGNVFWFGAYQFFGRLLSGGPVSDGSAVAQMSAGALAGMAYWGVPYPIDTIKSELQTAKSNESMLTIGRRIVAKRGISGLYNGLTVTLVRAIPGNAVTFFVYERVFKYLSNKQ